MATWFAQNSSVNIDSVNQWNSAANGSGSWLTWASLGASDVLVANGKTAITINVSVTCGTLTTLATGGTAGGGFILPSGITVTASLTAGSTTVITRTAAGTSYLVGAMYGSTTSSSVYTINNSGSGDLNITGNIYGGTSGANSIVIYHTGSGTVSITGSATGGSATNNVALYNSSGLFAITGNVNGGSTSHGIQTGSTSQIVVTGNVTAGTGSANGISCVSAGSTGSIKVTGDITAVGANAGIAIQTSAVTVTVIACGNLISSSVGTAAIGNGRILIPASTEVRHEYQKDSAGIANGARSLYTGGTNLGQPDIANVRSGTAFGAASEYTGTLAVPSPTLVAIGVSTDNTVGSYAPTGGLDAAGVRTAIGLATANLDTQLSGIQSDTNDIQTRLPAALESGRIAAELDSAATAALVDLIWDEPLTKATHNVANSSGKRLRQTTAFQQIDSTVIDAAATTTTFITDLTSPVDDFYNDSMLVFTDGALAGQVRAIYDYIGATKTIVLEEALTSAPVNGVAFAIVSLHIHPVSQIQSGLATAAALATESSKINRIEAVATGTVTGAGTSTEVFVGPSATLTITVDASGNRSAVVVT